MIRNIVLKVLSVISALLTILAVVCAITVRGGGFLDLSNIARVFFIGVAVAFGIIAVVAWINSGSND